MTARIVVFVEAGVVTGICSDIPDAEAVVVDMDTDSAAAGRLRRVATEDGDTSEGVMERIEVDLSPEVGAFFAAADRDAAAPGGA